jgi:hypothetical protein
LDGEGQRIGVLRTEELHGQFFHEGRERGPQPDRGKKRGNSTKVDVKRWVSDGRRFATGNERNIERKPWF